MAITFFNNWRSKDEFILIEISVSDGSFVFSLVGFGIVITI